MEERSHDITLRVALLAAVFSSLVSAAYAVSQIQPSPVVALFLSGGAAGRRDCLVAEGRPANGSRRGSGLGLFSVAGWPVVIPWYAFTTRGPAGWRLTVGLFTLIGANSISWILVTYSGVVFRAVALIGKRSDRRNAMSGSALYGAIMGLASTLLALIAPQPAGSIIWWTFLAGQLTWGAAVCWRRTGLPFATAAMAIAAATSAFLAALAATGQVFPDLPLGWWIPVGFGMLSVPLCLLLESRVHRAKWIRWRACNMERKNAWDILTVRHIPHLRDGGA